MNAETGRFESLDGMEKFDLDLAMKKLREARDRINPQYYPHNRQDPTLSIGEVVEIKGIRFRVLRIKADGKIALKMLHAEEK